MPARVPATGLSTGVGQKATKARGTSIATRSTRQGLGLRRCLKTALRSPEQGQCCGAQGCNPQKSQKDIAEHLGAGERH